MKSGAASAEATVERLLDRVRGSLLEIERQYRARGRSVGDAGLDRLARRMAAVVPVPSPVNELFGPFYRTEQVTRLLGMSRQAVADRVAKRTLLGMRTAEGTWVYPTFQIAGRRVLYGLADVLRCFDVGDAIDGWAVAAWLASPHAALAGRTPLACIRAGSRVEQVEHLAAAVARRWSQ